MKQDHIVRRYILLSAILGIAFFGGLKGVREGSIIAAVMIGNIIKMYNWLWNKMRCETKQE